MTDTRPAPSPPRPRSWTTLWYYVVVVGSLGLLSGIPFAHAATRLRGRPAAVWCAGFAVLYTAAIVVALVVTGNRTDPEDTTGGMILVIAMIVAVVHLTFVRRRIAGVPAAPAPAEPEPPAAADPAVAAILRARQARERARTIVESDPAMARELRIGRPDLDRRYDDGGLVDLNSAPADAIAWACGVDLPIAEQLVSARAAAGVPFQRVDDVFAWTEVPVGLWDRIRERAVVVP